QSIPPRTRSTGGKDCEEKGLKSNYPIESRNRRATNRSSHGPGRVAASDARRVAFAARGADLGVMCDDAAGRLRAVLGPTNTGKTHLAVERMCGHSSGLMGFPLRLLAREIYDRIVAAKGPGQVALLTGEEKILPDRARWFCCTAESMPTDRDFAFVALDEAQLGADRERGHVFTDRMLRARGRE